KHLPPPTRRSVPCSTTLLHFPPPSTWNEVFLRTRGDVFPGRSGWSAVEENSHPRARAGVSYAPIRPERRLRTPRSASGSGVVAAPLRLGGGKWRHRWRC